MIMVKKLLIFLAATLLSQSVSAYDFMVDGLCYNKNTDGTSVTVTYQNSNSPRYTSLSGELYIPARVTYDGSVYAVTKINNYSFYGCTGLTKINIPASVKIIGSAAFQACSGLKTVCIGKSVNNIGGSVFYGCTGFTEIVSLIQDPTKITLGSNAFYNVPTSTCVLRVPKGTYSAYKGCNQWKDFKYIKYLRSGDTDGNCLIDVSDVNLAIDMLLGKAAYDAGVDHDNNGVIDVSDIDFVIDVLLGKAYCNSIQRVEPSSTTADVVCSFYNAPVDATCNIKITEKGATKGTTYKGTLGELSQTIKATGLKVNTTYLATTYIYSGGDYYYGKDSVEFTTATPSGVVSSVSDVLVTTATAHCSFIGVDEGVEWGVKTKSAGNKTTTFAGASGNDVQSIDLSGLTAWTSYRCYAYVKAGDFYQEQALDNAATFTTLPNMSGKWTITYNDSKSILTFSQEGKVTITQVGDKFNGLYGTTVSGGWSAKNDGTITISFSDAHQTSSMATYYSVRIDGTLDNIHGSSKVTGKVTTNWVGNSGTDHYNTYNITMTRGN